MSFGAGAHAYQEIIVDWGGAVLGTSHHSLPGKGPRQAFECLIRPAVGFRRPYEVLKDPLLDEAEKRAILASWASDASAVEDQPHLRWLFSTEEPVPLDDILECLARLDGLSSMPLATSSEAPTNRSRDSDGAHAGIES